VFPLRASVFERGSIFPLLLFSFFFFFFFFSANYLFNETTAGGHARENRFATDIDRATRASVDMNFIV